MLVANHVSAWYGQTRALWDVDIRINRGEIVGILGRNGAGKTTLMRTLAGLQAKMTGEIVVEGEAIEKMRAHEIALLGLSLVREGGRMAASLTVLQHLSLGQQLGKSRKREGRTLDDVWRTFPLLEPLRDRRAGLLSGGQRQALALAIAYISSPLIFMLDEPSAGLSPQVAHDLFGTLRRLAGEGATIIVVEQHPRWLLGLASRGYLLEVGRIASELTITELVRDPKANESQQLSSGSELRGDIG